MFKKSDKRWKIFNDDAFALAHLLDDLGTPKYGSVSEEYERLSAERTRVLTYLSKFPSSGQPYFPPSDVSSGHPSSLSTRKPKVLDIADGANNSAIILVESDDEDNTKEAKPGQEPKRPFNQLLYGQSFVQLDENDKTKENMHDNELKWPFHHLVPYGQPVDHRFTSESSCQPSIQYQKVVLGNPCREDTVQNGGAAIARNAVNTKTAQDIGVLAAKALTNNFIQDVGVRKKGSGSVPGKASVKNSIPDNGVLKKGSDSVVERHAAKKRKRSLHIDPGSAPGKDADSNLNSTTPTTPNVDSALSPFIHTTIADVHPPDDGLDDLWREMSVAIECSKSATAGAYTAAKKEECQHSYVLEDDIGLVCRICGVIQKRIEAIFENQWVKGSRSIRTYMPGSRSTEDHAVPIEYDGSKSCIDDLLMAAEIAVHPRHMSQMKPHQLEGYSFLVRNLVSDKPCGCILAHAPGSGKTFMLISFIQSFLAKYPQARPLVVLPKGILSTWKREFERWQVENIPLYDFYSKKADSRLQQLEILIKWEGKRSILFLGYKQFATIICGAASSKEEAACQERLLKVPSLLIIDEGHTPRNEDTYVLESLAKVQTPRKVVLSGTLFQNHVQEVFNIVHLVRPRFMKLDSSRLVVMRVLSRVHISSGTRLPLKNGINKFYDLVEACLQDETDYKTKTTVIQDLRELTQNVIHYYKGDFLDELPGLWDFTVLLKPSEAQKNTVQMWEKSEKQKMRYVHKFKKSSVGNAIYIHPCLKDIAENSASDRASLFNDEKIDNIIDSLDVRDGVKTKFILNIMSMADAAGEKVLIFSQYLLPMKFLEKLITRVKGWHVGREIFFITGDSSSEDRELSMDQFNNSPNAKVLFGSIKACGEGISLVGASRVIVLDVHLNPSVTRQAIGRAFRPGQTKKVYIYRLVAADSLEEDDHATSFRKELISKMWFEWTHFHGKSDFRLEEIDLGECQDMFLESPVFAEDIKTLYKR